MCRAKYALLVPGILLTVFSLAFLAGAIYLYSQSITALRDEQDQLIMSSLQNAGPQLSLQLSFNLGPFIYYDHGVILSSTTAIFIFFSILLHLGGGIISFMASGLKEDLVSSAMVVNMLAAFLSVVQTGVYWGEPLLQVSECTPSGSERCETLTNFYIGMFVATLILFLLSGLISLMSCIIIKRRYH